MRPLLAIELDDASHKSFDRQDRDEFVERIFADAGVPLLRVPARRQYGVGELRPLLTKYAPVVRDREPQAAASAPETAAAAPASRNVDGNGKAAPKTIAAETRQESAGGRPTSAPLCPKCGQPMLLRTVAKGEHAGKQFYGCRNFPHCREVRPYKP